MYTNGMVSRRRACSAGFTLAELMVVVVIVGVLAVLAVVGIRAYVIAARANEAASVIQAIRVAQEAHRAETNTYLDVSDSYTSWHPRAVPDEKFAPFGEPTSGTPAQQMRWRLLDPSVAGEGVRWGYVTKAGPPGTAPQPLETRHDSTVNWGGSLNRSWYIIQARGDTDGDGHSVFMAASSLTGVVYDESSGD